MSVVDVLQSNSHKNKNVMQLLKCLFFYTSLQFQLSSDNVSGVENDLTDFSGVSGPGKKKITNSRLAMTGFFVSPTVSNIDTLGVAQLCLDTWNRIFKKISPVAVHGY